MNIQELKLKSSEQLITQAEELGIENASTLRKQEILIQGKESFLESGGKNFDMVPCLNDNDDHIALLRSLIQNNI